MSINYLGFFEPILFVFPLLFLSIGFIWYSFQAKNGLPVKWPVIGMLPAVLKHQHRLHDCAVEIMEKSSLNFMGEGPWFTNMRALISADPANVEHVFVKNFGNYPKGSKFKEIFDVLGDGIFNTDAEMWKYHRKMAQRVFAHPEFNKFLVKKIWEKIEVGLIPILDHASKNKLEIELQDLLGRFAFDTISSVTMDYDPTILSIHLPNLPFSEALRDVEHTFVYRHVVPSFVWKFQRWLGVGLEKKYKEAWKTIDDFVYGCISRKREEMSKVGNELGVDVMTLYMDEVGDSDKILRDTIVSFFAAGRDSTGAALTWVFYLISKHQHVLSKLKEELNDAIAQVKHRLSDDHMISKKVDMHEILSRNLEELNEKLVYLHAVVLESLRLYPPVPFEAKAPQEPDTLPSGHKVNPSMQIIFSLYAMGRMKSIWGEDCCEFKPERWILETGKLRHVPSHKFFSFIAGPRTCLGKNMSLILIKAVVMAIISKYRIEPVQGHPIVPAVSIILHMKHGFKVNVVSY